MLRIEKYYFFRLSTFDFDFDFTYDKATRSDALTQRAKHNNRKKRKKSMSARLRCSVVFKEA